MPEKRPFAVRNWIARPGELKATSCALVGGGFSTNHQTGIHSNTAAVSQDSPKGKVLEDLTASKSPKMVKEAQSSPPGLRTIRSH
jgi:hypothetical protein